MDIFGSTIANLHQSLGHEKAAAVLGVPPWPYGEDVPCLLCTYEQEPTDTNRQAVVEALAARSDTTGGGDG